MSTVPAAKASQPPHAINWKKSLPNLFRLYMSMATGAPPAARRTDAVRNPVIFKTSATRAHAGTSQTNLYDSKFFWMSRPDIFAPRNTAQGAKNEASKTAAAMLVMFLQVLVLRLDGDC